MSGGGPELDKVLVVDDEVSTRESLRMILKDHFRVETAESGEEALELINREEPQVIILDIIMPGLDGMEVLQQIRELNPDIPVIMLTATQMVRTAVEAMKSGAFDYINKPFEVEEIRIIVEKALEKYALTSEVKMLRGELENRYGFSNIIGKSKEMRDIYRTIQLIAGKKATVLIVGESGTGKELIARAIHFNGTRRSSPFVAVNCAAIPEGLIESELFGHEKGAFTDARFQKPGQFEMADGGTLFLDEIGELSLATQAKILRTIQEMEFKRVGGTTNIKVDVRLIAATNKNLERAVEEGSFRSDLYYRLNVVPIFIPPLRKRREDIPLLLDHFLKQYTLQEEVKPKKMSLEAIDFLAQYDWPGNVRELENVVERIVALCPQEEIFPDDLPLKVKKSIKLNAFKHAVLEGRMSLEKAEGEFLKDIILEAMEKADHVQTRAAELLGISRRVLKYKMDHLGIEPKKGPGRQA
jgi:DNA-binding NtrC family response regulator